MVVYNARNTVGQYCLKVYQSANHGLTTYAGQPYVLAY